MKKLQIFVSSTYEDLDIERQIVFTSILKIGHIPAGMEFFTGNEKINNLVLKWIDDSDIYILLLGGRYGSIEKRTGKSYTQIEYEYARKNNKPMFIISFTDTYLRKKIKNISDMKKVYEYKNKVKYKNFRKEITDTFTRQVNNQSEIEGIVAQEIEHITNNNTMVGWCKLDKVIDDFSEIDSKILLQDIKNISTAYFNKFRDDKSLYLETISEQIEQIFKVKAILKSNNRIITLKPIGKLGNKVKVITQRIEEFLWINKEKEKCFSLYDEMMKKQKETFKVEKLVIDDIDYTQKMKDNYYFEKREDRGQFIYILRGKIVLSKKYYKVTYTSSYECSIQDYFHSYKTVYPCMYFFMHITMLGYEKKYTLLCSSFATNNREYDDDFDAKEVQNMQSSCIVKFEHLILPGAGYAVTVKRRKI